MPLPANLRIDRFANTPEDYQQDRQVLAVEYYGNAWERLGHRKRTRVEKWHQRHREQYQTAGKRTGEVAHVSDAYPLADGRRPVLSYDVRRCLEMLWQEFPDEVVDAAFEMIEQQEACELLGWSKHTVEKRVTACRAKARAFLGREFDEKDWLYHRGRIEKS
jgi:DNA-directed RNA polymerase specialized sigma24 family protein